jgi:hypothetical protein
MKLFVPLYFLIQSLLLGIFVAYIYNTFIENFDTLLLIIDILTFVLSLHILIIKRYNKILYFSILLTFSIFTTLFEIPLLMLGNGAFMLFLLSTAQFVLNIYLSFIVLKESQELPGQVSDSPTAKSLH